MTDNVNSTTLSVVKQEKVPVEETFGKIDIPQLESKSCCTNCISSLDNLDKKISLPLQTYTPNLCIEIIFLIFAKLFNTITVIIYLILILFYSIFIAENFKIFIIVLIHVLVGVFLTVTIKKITGRERPLLTVKRYFYKVRTNEMMNSMPSGDCLQSANFALMIILYFDEKNYYKFFSVLFIPMSMLGRVFYCCHYWFDCFVGAFIGIFISYGCFLFINKFNIINKL